MPQVSNNLPRLLSHGPQVRPRRPRIGQSISSRPQLPVESIALRLNLLLASDDPIDTGILRTVLQSLFNQLATLIHRAFPALMPSVLPNRKAFQHCLSAAGRGVQAAYKELWAAASLTGMLRRDVLITESSERSILTSHETAVQQLLWRTGELADELRLWLALLRAGRSL
jgi:hypothetical protein